MAKSKVVFKSGGKKVSLDTFMKNVEKEAIRKAKDKLEAQGQAEEPTEEN